MGQIYFSSDWHYGHKNIVKGVSNWESKNGCRDFDTLEEHNTTLVNNINNVVKADDVIYFLGDFSFGGMANIWEFRKQIRCKNIHVILGNHDKHIRENKDVPYKGTGTIKSHELFKSVNEYLELKINGTKICLFHYSQRVWNRSYRGAWQLHGHSHGSLHPYTNVETMPKEWIGQDFYTKSFKTMDVGIDTHPEFRPYHISEIHDIMREKHVLLEVDHHGKDTKG